MALDFDLSEEQKLLKSMARDFLTVECPKKFVREMVNDEKGYSPELWRKMGELGWMGLVFPEVYGGAGGSFLDLTVLLEEMGRACLPSPFFSTVVLGGMVIHLMGNEDQKRNLLPKIIQGDLIITLALSEPTTRYNLDRIATEATADGHNYIINGTKLFVPDANIADYIICVARASDGVTLFLVDARNPNVICESLKTIGGDKQFEVVFNKVSVPKENTIGGLGKGYGLGECLRIATVAKCAEMVGMAQQVFDMTLNYAKERIQFGRPIGSFQVIQHYLANMLTDVETSRFVTYEAAFNLSRGIPCIKEAAVAKAWVGEALRRIVALGHQIHGGIGFSADYDLYLYSRRAKAAEVVLGDSEFQREIIAQEIGL